MASKKLPRMASSKSIAFKSSKKPVTKAVVKGGSPAKSYGDFTKDYLKKNPKAERIEIDNAFKKLPGGSSVFKNFKVNPQELAKINQKKAQDKYLKSGGKLKAGEVYDPYAMLQKASQTGGTIGLTTQKESDAIRRNIGGTTDYKTPLSQQKKSTDKLTFKKDDGGGQPYESQNNDLEDNAFNNEEFKPQMEEMEAQKQEEQYQSEQQAQSLSDQMQAKQAEIQNLVSNLNSKQQGLGDTVSSVLDDLAQSGSQVQLNESTLKMIEEMAMNTPPDQMDEKINQMIPATPAPQPKVDTALLPPPTPTPPPAKQQYSSLKNAGMTNSEIIKQDPSMMSKIIPDGTIINPNTGVGLIQTPTGEAYKLPSGLIVPRDATTGFYNLSALSPDQQKKLTFTDVMAIDLSTQKTASDMKAFYNATTFQQMAARNDREYEIGSLELESYYNSENNRINESQVKVMQELEIEKMRQELSKETSLSQLHDAKSKTSNIMKAQMDAWGLEGSSTVMAAMSAHSLKFEQEASLITKNYDINIMQMAMASTQTQMEFTNRVTELNQKMQVQKLEMKSEYLGKKDEIDKSVLLSKQEQILEQQNMYRDYAAKIYEHEQEVQAAAAAAEKEAQAQIWEKQKYYSEQMGMLVEVGEDGSINPMTDEEGNPVLTLSGKTADREERKFEFDIAKFEDDVRRFDLDYALKEQGQEFNQNLDMAKFEQDAEQFGLTYALDQQKQAFTEYASERDFSLEGAKFDFENQKYFDSLSQYEDIYFDENADTYMGKTKTGLVDLGKDYGKMGVAVPLNGKFEFNVVGPGEVRFNVPLGKLETRGECGMLVNDALGLGNTRMRDTYEEKMQLNNSPGMPVAGGAFVEKIPGLASGHTGLVEKVNKNPDGSVASFEIRESNYHGTWNVTTETIYAGSSRWKTIVEQGGFYDPVKGGTSKKGPGGGGASGSGEYSKFEQQAKAEGMTDPKSIKKKPEKLQSKVYMNYLAQQVKKLIQVCKKV